MGVKRRIKAAARAFRHPGLVDDAMGIRRAGQVWKKSPLRNERVQAVAESALERAGVSQGRMLELRAGKTSHREMFPQFEYHSLNLDNCFEGTRRETVHIDDYAEIPDESFDFVFSAGVLEHVEKPWLLAENISRILKPGGVTVHATLFSWRYHPQPIDYWRFSADGIKSLFPTLLCLHSDFDYTERRRDLRGQGNNLVKPDAFGGWRENVGVLYAGQKTRAVKLPKGR